MADSMELLTVCPLCGGALALEKRDMSFIYKGKSKIIQQPGQYCVACGEGFLSPADTSSTRKETTDFHRSVDKLLTTDEIKAARGSLKMSQKKAGEIFGGGPMAFSKYERGEVTQNKSTDRLIRLLVKGKIKIEDLEEIDDDELKQM
jgi:HTH-type transcriptional regulator / antitoxin MqsA